MELPVVAIDPRQCGDRVYNTDPISHIGAEYRPDKELLDTSVSLISNWPVMTIDGYGWNAGMSKKEPFL